MSQISRHVTASSMGAILTLTGDAGGPVSPTAGNINILGDLGVFVDGNPGTSTLTISVLQNVLTYTNVNTTPYVVLDVDSYLSVDTSALAITIRLPNSAVYTGQVYYIKDRIGDAATRNITVTTVGGVVLIDGATTFVMNTAYESANFIWNGTSWEIF